MRGRNADAGSAGDARREETATVMIEGASWEAVAARFAWRVSERCNAARNAMSAARTPR